MNNFSFSLFELIGFIIFAGVFLFFIILFFLFVLKIIRRYNFSQHLFSAIDYPVWICLRGKIIWSNKAFLKAVAASTISQVQENNLHLLDDELRLQIANFHKGGENKYNKRVRITLFGQRRLVELYDIAFLGGSVGLAIDINETLEIGEKLENTLQSQREVLNELNTAIASFDSAHILTFYNQAFEELWQLSPDVLAKPLDNSALFDLLRAKNKLPEPPDWKKWREQMLSLYQSQTIYEDVWHIPNGKALRVICSPQKHGGVTWVFEDISETLNLQSRYNILSKVQGETLDHLKEGVVVFGMDGKLKLLNPSFVKLWQLPSELSKADTAINKIAEHCASLTVESELWQQFILAITGGDEARMFLSGRLSTRGSQRLDYILQPLPNGQNLLIFSDVTVEQLKTDFLQHISTEFRRPLTNIIGFSQFLQSGVKSEKQNEYIEDIISSAQTLSGMVNNILDLATFEAGVLELQKVKIDIKTPIENAIKSLAQELKQKNITLNCQIESFMFVGDEGRLQQIFFNLLTNAIRFSPNGKTIYLATQEEKTFIIFTIADEGAGVPVAKQATLFNRFHSTADAGASRAFGFGLSIVRSLIELHGGKIELDTTVKQGAKFKCYFPKGQIDE